MADAVKELSELRRKVERLKGSQETKKKNLDESIALLKKEYKLTPETSVDRLKKINDEVTVLDEKYDAVIESANNLLQTLDA